ncbi:hypothetical protein BT96DRAFT_932328 [Gymnopus androsaceus JB14]|uniref:CCHC-type domain-containing protein n=1 Tax=Gymnopus androsaceus JB14 TaxID=1447944 RepID=A0A6A4IA97_9AGAR|nr:hypothetical protein BT96DRAFT_932328 [Gymnopus androsaceus JB14]
MAYWCRIYYQNLVEREIGIGMGGYILALHEWEEFLDLFGQMFGLHNKQLTSQAALDNTIQKSVPEKLLRKLDWLAPITSILTWGESQLTLPQTNLVLQQEQDLRKMQIPQMQFNNANRNTGAPNAQAKLADMGLNEPQESTAPVSREERNQRMREGLCIRCGKPGHIRRDHDKRVVLKGATTDYCSCKDCDEDCTCCNELTKGQELVEARAAFTVIGESEDEDISLILELENLEMEA